MFAAAVARQTEHPMNSVANEGTLQCGEGLQLHVLDRGMHIALAEGLYWLLRVRESALRVCVTVPKKQSQRAVTTIYEG